MPEKSPDFATIKWSQRFVTDKKVLQVNHHNLKSIHSSLRLVMRFHDVASRNVNAVNGCRRVP